MEKQRNSCKAHTYQWQNQIGTDGCLDSRQVLIAQPCLLLFGPAGAGGGDHAGCVLCSAHILTVPIQCQSVHWFHLFPGRQVHVSFSLCYGEGAEFSHLMPESLADLFL